MKDTSPDRWGKRIAYEKRIVEEVQREITPMDSVVDVEIPSSVKRKSRHRSTARGSTAGRSSALPTTPMDFDLIYPA